jgi:hypothetical protein
MILSERQTDQGLLVSVCDTDIMGETFEDGAISLTVDEDFYGGDEVDESTVVESLARAQVANIVGHRAVDVAVNAGIIDAANVLEVDGTRHAQLVRL